MHLRDDLVTLAGRAEPLHLRPELVVAKVKRRRRHLGIVSIAASLAVVLGVVATVGSLDARRGGPAPAATPSYRPFVCGDALELGPGAASAQAGLAMSLSAHHEIGSGAGPGLTVTFTAARTWYVSTSPASMFEVLYLRDGVIVGGGPMLNEAGDLSSQGFDLIGAGFPVGPDRPWSELLGPRDRLCSTLTWPQVWARPQSYEAVLVMGPILQGSDQDRLRLDMPTLGRSPLLVARATLVP